MKTVKTSEFEKFRGQIEILENEKKVEIKKLMEKEIEMRKLETHKDLQIETIKKEKQAEILASCKKIEILENEKELENKKLMEKEIELRKLKTEKTVEVEKNSQTKEKLLKSESEIKKHQMEIGQLKEDSEKLRNTLTNQNKIVIENTRIIKENEIELKKKNEKISQLENEKVTFHREKEMEIKISKKKI